MESDTDTASDGEGTRSDDRCVRVFFFVFFVFLCVFVVFFMSVRSSLRTTKYVFP